MKISTIKGVLFLVLAFFSSNILADYHSVVGDDLDYTSPDSWVLPNGVPLTSPNAKIWITSGSHITLNEDFSPVDVEVSGRLTIKKNYIDRSWNGLIINSGGVVEIEGDFTTSRIVRINKGGTLIVHGNYISGLGNDIYVSGNLIVKGNFSSASSASITDEGNIVVGGNFSHESGAFTVNDAKFYVINPDAEIVLPSGWDETHLAQFGRLEDLLENEGENRDLLDWLVDLEMILPKDDPITGFQNAETNSLIDIIAVHGNVVVTIDSQLLIDSPGHIVLYDLVGKKVGEYKTASNRTEFSLPQISGIYIVAVQVGRVSNTVKLVK